MRGLVALGLFAAGILLGSLLPAGAPEQSVPDPRPPSKSTSRNGPRQATKREHPGITAIRDARSRSAQAKAIVELATRLPVADLERWFRGNYLEFLDGKLEGLFYQITRARWLEGDPVGYARYRVSKGSSHTQLIPSFENWVELDREGAIEFVRGLPHDWNGGRAAIALAVGLGKSDVPAAIKALEEFKARWEGESWMLRETIGTISLNDREAILNYVREWDDRIRAVGLTSIAAAWLERDFDWVVEMLAGYEMSWRGLQSITSSPDSSAGSIFLENLSKVPAEWLPGLAETTVMTHGNEDEWLQLREHPSLSPELLDRIHRQAASGPTWTGARRADAMALIMDGDWLSISARRLLVQAVLNGWHENNTAARAWLESLDENLQSGFANPLEGREESQARLVLASRMRDPQQAVQALLDSEKRTSGHNGSDDWSAEDIQTVLADVANLAPEEALRIVRRDQFLTGWPPEFVAHLMSRALNALPAEDQNARTSIVRGLQSSAGDWAHVDPAAAGAWVLTLPVEVRERAVSDVATYWARFSPAEVREWTEKLTENEREMVQGFLP